MTTVDETPDAGGGVPGADPDVGDATPAARQSNDVDSRRAGRGLAGELLLSLELAGLCAFAFSRPVLDSFGRSPETFVARGADAPTIVVFGFLVALVPILVVALVGAATRLLGIRVRWWAHLVLLGILGGLTVWRLGQDITGFPPSASEAHARRRARRFRWLVVLRVRVPSSKSFLRYAGVASVVFLVQFLFMSPASSLIGGDGTAARFDVARAVQAAVGDDAPPVVVPGDRHVPDTGAAGRHRTDRRRAVPEPRGPRGHRRPGTATTRRSSGFTNEAVPALLSGLFRPEGTEFGGSGPTTTRTCSRCSAAPTTCTSTNR